MWIGGEIAPQEQFLPFSTIVSTYISNYRSLITYSFVKFGCAICIFNSENLIFEVRISRSVSEGPFNFEIRRVDCSCKLLCAKFLVSEKLSFFIKYDTLYKFHPISGIKDRILMNLIEVHQ